MSSQHALGHTTFFFYENYLKEAVAAQWRVQTRASAGNERDLLISAPRSAQSKMAIGKPPGNVKTTGVMLIISPTECRLVLKVYGVASPVCTPRIMKGVESVFGLTFDL